MYRGLGPLILGYLPTWMVYFTVYETTKKSLDGSRLPPKVLTSWKVSGAPWVGGRRGCRGYIRRPGLVDMLHELLQALNS
jgi:hypothetical protein